MLLYISVSACRSVDAALRRSIPAFNRDVKDMQSRLEDVAFKLRIPQRKPWQGMADNVQASLVLAQQPDKVHALQLDNVHFLQPDRVHPLHNWCPITNI